MADFNSHEIQAHPAEVTYLTNQAIQKTHELIKAAERRGDTAGAQAWRDSLVVLEKADCELRAARHRQDWAAKRKEPCGTCGLIASSPNVTVAG